LPAFVAGGDTALVGAVDAVEGLTVDVELQLAGSAVADPDRGRSPVALPVVEDLLGQIAGAIDPVHDVERAAAVLVGLFVDPVAKPPPQRRRLVREAQAEEGVHRKGGIAYPGVAVV